jgi:hypothetical protein
MMFLWLFSLWVGLVVANYIYQYFTKKDWKKAYEISYYQIIPFVLIGVMSLGIETTH